jgi:probable UDP-sugar transporter A4
MSPSGQAGHYGATDRLDRRMEREVTGYAFRINQYISSMRFNKSELFSTAAPFTYLVLYCVFDILASWSAKSNGGYYKFEPACVVLCVEIGKLIVTSLLMCVWPPEYLPVASKFFKVAFFLSGPAVCYTAINVITLVSLAKVSLAHYAVWYQVGIFFNAFLWWVAFQRPFGWQRSFALVLLAVGCALNSVGPDMNIAINAHVWLVIASSFISAVGCVLNEYFYKQDARLDLNLQNAVLYSLTSIFCLLLLFFVWPHRLASTRNFFEGFHTECWILVGVQVFIGLSVSRILKYASVITKNYVMALHVPIEVVCAHFLIGSSLTVFTFISAMLIGISTCVYYTAGLQTPTEKEVDAAAAAAAAGDKKASDKILKETA